EQGPATLVEGKVAGGQAQTRSAEGAAKGAATGLRGGVQYRSGPEGYNGVTLTEFGQPKLLMPVSLFVRALQKHENKGVKATGTGLA
ncbi:MAG: hypothetical protein KC488_10230, partial [Candidatus Cloacimonetes bacterium]|nr:hypothetical protein [Candidatus Cloacimonadota bacterium]